MLRLLEVRGFRLLLSAGLGLWFPALVSTRAGSAAVQNLTVCMRPPVHCSLPLQASLTIDGIYYVVDPGFAKQKVFNPKVRSAARVALHFCARCVLHSDGACTQVLANRRC